MVFKNKVRNVNLSTWKTRRLLGRRTYRNTHS